MPGPEIESESRARRKPASFPWLPLLLLAGTIYAFWILPRQLPQRPVRVEFRQK